MLIHRGGRSHREPEKEQEKAQPALGGSERDSSVLSGRHRREIRPPEGVTVVLKTRPRDEESEPGRMSLTGREVRTRPLLRVRVVRTPAPGGSRSPWEVVRHCARCGLAGHTSSSECVLKKKGTFPKNQTLH